MPGHGQSVPTVSSILPHLDAAQIKEKYFLNIDSINFNTPESNMDLHLLEISVTRSLGTLQPQTSRRTPAGQTTGGPAAGMCGAEHFSAGRGNCKNLRGGTGVKIRGARQKSA